MGIAGVVVPALVRKLLPFLVDFVEHSRFVLGHPTALITSIVVSITVREIVIEASFVIALSIRGT